MYTFDSVSACILANCEAQPKNPAMIYHDQTITYGQLAQQTRRAACRMLALGVRPKDRIAYVLRPEPAFFYTVLAAGMIGAVAVGVAYRGPEQAAQVILEESGACGLVCEAEQTEKYRALCGAERFMLTEESLTAADPTPEQERLLDELAKKVCPDDDLLILYTSGTTSRPKGAVLSHRNILASAYMQNHNLFSGGLLPTDVVNHSLPVNHVSGAVESGLGILAGGACMLLFSGFNPVEILSAAERYHATILSGVPAMWNKLLEVQAAAHYDLSSVRFAISGAAPLTEELANRILGWTVCINPMGMTETSGFCSGYLQRKDPQSLIQTVGRLMPELEGKIIREDGKPVEAGEIGQICYRGDSIIRRYTNQPLPVDEEGFFLSGDVGFFEEDGTLHICGRNDDMFTVGGYNVFPQEVEETLRRYEGVADAVVVPYAHHSMGNVCVACLMARTPIDAEALEAFAAETLIYYKVPKKYVIFEQFPMNAMGKVDRKKLKALLQEKSI